MYRKQYSAPDLRAAGMFNLSVIPDWEMIGSARRRLSSLDHFSEEVNPQDFNTTVLEWWGFTQLANNQRAQLLVMVTGCTTTNATIP